MASEPEVSRLDVQTLIELLEADCQVVGEAVHDPTGVLDHIDRAQRFLCELQRENAELQKKLEDFQALKLHEENATLRERLEAAERERVQVGIRWKIHHPNCEYSIQNNHGELWLCWKHPDGQWVTEVKVAHRD